MGTNNIIPNLNKENNNNNCADSDKISSLFQYETDCSMYT